MAVQRGDFIDSMLIEDKVHWSSAVPSPSVLISKFVGIDHHFEDKKMPYPEQIIGLWRSVLYTLTSRNSLRSQVVIFTYNLICEGLNLICEGLKMFSTDLYL